MMRHQFVECDLPKGECSWDDECHYAQDRSIDCFVLRQDHDEAMKRLPGPYLGDRDREGRGDY